MKTINKQYLAGAKKEIKRIYKLLGYSPTLTEYNKNAATIYNLKRLKKQNITLNQLKEAAKIPLLKSGMKTGTKLKSSQTLIYCLAYNGKIMAADCMPKYRDICDKCPSKQKNNVKPIPNIPEEIEQISRYDISCGNKYLNGNDIYMTDVCII